MSIDDSGDDDTGDTTDNTRPPNRAQLSNVCFVLCRPQGPGNIGSIARVMNNFGITDLRIVTPEPGALEAPYNELLDDGSDRAVYSAAERAKAPLADEARIMSVHAAELLTQAMRCQSAKDAIADCVYVYATTARPRENLQIQSVRDCVTNTLSDISQTGKVAILFGNEATGLTNEELSLASLGVMIPTAGFGVPEQPGVETKKQQKRYTGGVGPTSLNLSQAVGVMAYEIHEAIGNNQVTGFSSRLMTTEERIRLTDELHAARRSLDVLGGETDDGDKIDDSDSPESCDSPRRLEHLENERERRAVANVLNAGPIATRDAAALFTLARRVQESKKYSKTDDAVLEAANRFREEKRKKSEINVKALIKAIREECGVSMTTRETEKVIKAMGIGENEP